MSRIKQVFERLRSEGSAAFIPYVCVGDPDRDFTLDLLRGICSSGADIIELGIPFSDPVADGPTIQQAMVRSLSGGFKVTHIFETISKLRSDGVRQPIVVMSYYNPIFRYGPRDFCNKLAASGADGLLIVDLPLEESSEVDSAAESTGLDMIRLVAPTTEDRRLREILARGSGFVYVVSVAGTTGERMALSANARSLVRRVCAQSRLPVALGFGISAPEHVRQAVGSGASGVVEGSKLVSIYSESLDDRRSALGAACEHVREMKAATMRTSAE